MKVKCPCGVPYLFVATKKQNDLLYDFFYCPKCGTPTHDIRYRYDPSNCPGHQPEHIGVKFMDDAHAYQLVQVDRCTRCGAVRETLRDTRGAGLSGRIEIDDPRVTKRLLYNRSSWDRVIPLELRELSECPPPKEVYLPAEADV